MNIIIERETQFGELRVWIIEVRKTKDLLYLSLGVALLACLAWFCAHCCLCCVAMVMHHFLACLRADNWCFLLSFGREYMYLHLGGSCC